MSHLVSRSVMKRLIAAGNCSRHFPSSSAAGLQPQGSTVVLIGWRRMMSAAAEQPSTSAVVEKADKSSSVAAAKLEKGDLMVSSYWGISKPKITREDGVRIYNPGAHRIK